jgi:hypothetical protein
VLLKMRSYWSEVVGIWPLKMDHAQSSDVSAKRSASGFALASKGTQSPNGDRFWIKGVTKSSETFRPATTAAAAAVLA